MFIPKPKRALFISMPSPKYLETASIVTAKLVKAMEEDGWQMDMVGMSYKDSGHAEDPTLAGHIDKERLYEAGCFLNKRFTWVFSAYRLARKLTQKNNYDFIFTFSPHTWSNVVGWLLKKKTKLSWIAFFADPWGNSPDLKFKFLRRIIEKQVLLTADAVVYSNYRLESWALSQFPGLRDKISHKVFAIPYFYDSKLYPSIQEKGLKEKIIFRHLGQIPVGGYIISLLYALKMLFDENPDIAQKVIFEFYGKASPKYNGKVEKLSKTLKLENQVVFHSDLKKIIHVPYSESLRLMKEADALVLLGIHPSYFHGWGDTILHIKLIDYIGANKPIFALCGKNSLTSELLNDGISICSSDSPAEIKDVLLKFILNTPKLTVSLKDKFSKANVYPLWKNMFAQTLRKDGRKS